MFSTLMIVSTDQGNLAPAPRAVGPFDSWLLDDIDYDAKILHERRNAKLPRPTALIAYVRQLLAFGLPLAREEMSTAIKSR